MLEDINGYGIVITIAELMEVLMMDLLLKLLLLLLFYYYYYYSL